MPLDSFSGFQPYKTANFKGAFPKTEVLGKPRCSELKEEFKAFEPQGVGQ
jgi:hypothetical protein